jgi:hypothetical protein
MTSPPMSEQADKPAWTPGTGVQCWPEGHATRSACEREIPDTDYETMRQFGWGFVHARDNYQPSGIGAFYACPEHRDDCTEEGREIARTLNRAALSRAGQ